METNAIAKILGRAVEKGDQRDISRWTGLSRVRWTR
jgi:hypothetical protein